MKHLVRGDNNIAMILRFINRYAAKLVLGNFRHSPILVIDRVVTKQKRQQYMITIRLCMSEGTELIIKE